MYSFSLKKYVVMLFIFFTAGLAQAESFVEFIMVGQVWPEHKWGHVSLRVKDADQDLVFDFGRYGRMWGFFNTEGDPILRVWKSPRTHMYAQKEGNPVIHSIRFKTTSAQAQSVLRYFDTVTEELSPYTSTAKVDSYRLKGPAFHSVNNNCVTMSIRAFMSGFPNLNVNQSKYATGDDLYFWARVKAKGVAYNSSSKTWKHIWWPKDLLNLLQKEYVKKGLAVEETY